MPINDNSVIQYESGQAAQAFEAMTDTGDKKKFDSSFSPWSGRSGYEAKVRPYGLATGGKVTPGSGNNAVDIAALTAYMAGAAGADAEGLISVSAASGQTVTRAVTDPYIVNSITVNSSGAIAVVTGAEGTAFSETRGAAGGPPLIPDGSIEIAQVRLSAVAAAAVTAGEIFQVVGLHQERYDFPIWSEDNAEGQINFAAALPAIHTGNIPKQVWVKGFTPIFAELSRTRDWVPAEETHAVNSQQNYDGAEATTTTTLNQGSFTASLKDGITDPILGLKGENLWFRFYQDRNKLPYQLTQGKLGVGRTYAVGGQPTGNFTISAAKATLDMAG